MEYCPDHAWIVFGTCTNLISAGGSMYVYVWVKVACVILRLRPFALWLPPQTKFFGVGFAADRGHHQWGEILIDDRFAGGLAALSFRNCSLHGVSKIMVLFSTRPRLNSLLSL
jgi:hypothetical protein